MIKTIEYGDVLRFDLARTIAGRGRYWTTAYYVDGLLVDSGCAYTAKELENVLSDKPLHQIINTHSHEDHIGANGPLQRHREGVRIFAHPLALSVFKDPRKTQPLHFYRRLFWGWSEACEAEAIEDSAIVETEHHKFKVVYTPGHSKDHLCLYEAQEAWLFSGDLFVGGKDRALRAGSDIWQIISSLKSIATMPIKTLFPGSAQVRVEPVEALNEKIAYLEDLGQKVVEFYDKGWDERAIARTLLGGVMWVEVVTLGNFSRRNLIQSFLRIAERSHHGSEL